MVHHFVFKFVMRFLLKAVQIHGSAPSGPGRWQVRGLAALELGCGDDLRLGRGLHGGAAAGVVLVPRAAHHWHHHV